MNIHLTNQAMKRTILIVDDDASVRGALQRLLEGAGYRVVVARSRAQALDSFDSAQVDLVVMDVNLGEDDGWETFERMAEIDNSIPTVIATAEFGQHKRAIAAGAEALIEKPMDVAAFLETIEELLAERPRRGGERLRNDKSYCRFVQRPGDVLRRDLQDRCSTPLNMAWFDRLAAGIDHEP
jgi:CheY-like chemotaxis protein